MTFEDILCQNIENWTQGQNGLFPRRDAQAFGVATSNVRRSANVRRRHVSLPHWSDPA